MNIADFLYSDTAIWIVRAIIVIIGIIVFYLIYLITESKEWGCGSLLIFLILAITFVFGVHIILTIIYALILAFICYLISYFIIEPIKKKHKKIIASGERRSFNKMDKKANNPKKKMTSKEYHALAEKYEKGIGVEISLRKALEYYRKAAECGDAKEKRAFGKRYEKGDFIVRKADMTEAQKWYDAADEWEKKNKK